MNRLSVGSIPIFPPSPAVIGARLLHPTCNRTISCYGGWTFKPVPHFSGGLFYDEGGERLRFDHLEKMRPPGLRIGVARIRVPEVATGLQVQVLPLITYMTGLWSWPSLSPSPVPQMGAYGRSFSAG